MEHLGNADYKDFTIGVYQINDNQGGIRGFQAIWDHGETGIFLDTGTALDFAKSQIDQLEQQIVNQTFNIYAITIGEYSFTIISTGTGYLAVAQSSYAPNRSLCKTYKTLQGARDEIARAINHIRQ